MSESGPSSDAVRALKIYVIAGEHSGDALGAKLMAAIRSAHSGGVVFSGVGGELMERQGLASLFPMSEVAVMGPLAILKRLPPIVKRVYQTIDAIVADPPDCLVIIDAPEFTHAIAKRVRRKKPGIPIVNYVSPTVWAWRPGRARAMRPYVDHLMALLPFEPEAHAKLAGPPCTYVGHPLAERIEAIRALDATVLRTRLGLDPARKVLVVLPGSRRSEVGRLLEPFRRAVNKLVAAGRPPEVLLPVVSSSRDVVVADLPNWAVRPHILEGEDDKWMAFRLADAALAASGTVTLELAVAGTPMVIAYKVERVLAAVLRRVVQIDKAGLPNLILGEHVFPELIQEACTPEALAAAMMEVLGDSSMRRRQLAGLGDIPRLLAVPNASPSDAAAEIVVRYAVKGRRG